MTDDDDPPRMSLRGCVHHTIKALAIRLLLVAAVVAVLALLLWWSAP